jgi:hypothetical protein
MKQIRNLALALVIGLLLTSTVYASPFIKIGSWEANEEQPVDCLVYLDKGTNPYQTPVGHSYAGRGYCFVDMAYMSLVNGDHELYYRLKKGNLQTIKYGPYKFRWPWWNVDPNTLIIEPEMTFE